MRRKPKRELGFHSKDISLLNVFCAFDSVSELTNIIVEGSNSLYDLVFNFYSQINVLQTALACLTMLIGHISEPIRGRHVAK